MPAFDATELARRTEGKPKHRAIVNLAKAITNARFSKGEIEKAITELDRKELPEGAEEVLREGLKQLNEARQAIKDASLNLSAKLQ